MAELVVALDFDDALDALNMAGALRGHVSWVKVGLELFISEGPRVLHSLKGLGFNVFLDLKLYDIPNTVRGAALAAQEHAPLLMGVPVLTSFAEGELPGCSMLLGDLAKTLASGAAAWGMNGVVCSGHEVAAIKKAHPALLCLTPGIRLAGSGGDDQRRVMTPAQAVRNGSDFLVVGRPITRAEHPAAVADAVQADILNVKTSEK